MLILDSVSATYSDQSYLFIAPSKYFLLHSFFFCIRDLHHAWNYV